MDRDAINKLLGDYFTAFNQLDAKAVASLFSEDAMWCDLAMAREMRGPAEVAAFVTEIAALSPDFSLVRRRTVIDGDHAVVLHDMTGHQNAEFMGFAATGRIFDVPVSSHFEFRGGKISSLTDNWNLYALLAGLGLIASESVSATEFKTA